MGNLQIVTDSTADLPEDVVKEYGIKVVPLSVNFGDQQYIDGVNLTAKEFYEKLRQEPKIPTTSQPAPGQFADVYRKAVEAGRKVLSIHISSKLSGTYQAASLAAEMVGKEHITVVDSVSVSLGLGMQVIAAAKNSHTLETARQAALDAKKQLGLLFLVDTLEYMEKNGRIGRAASLLGSLLQIKPVLTFTDGTVDVTEKVRGSRRAYRRLLEIFKERVGGTAVDVAVVHGGVEAEAKELIQEVQGLAECAQIYLNYISPVVGSHGGPGILGLIWKPASI
ncbi:MAG: DegV family protein [Firmicutes bacterium]|nr:DegV family protein [Bacillota bacterium]